MKLIGKAAVVLAGAILLSVSGTAQAAMDTVVKANVPFAFVVNGKSMPAGKYTIQRDDLSPGLLLIRSDHKSNHAAVFVLTTKDGRREPGGDRPVLTFNHVENTYQLASVWESQDDGYDVAAR